MLSHKRLGALTSAVAACLLLAACSGGGGGPSSTALLSIAVTPQSPTIKGGGATRQFTATGTYSDSSTRDLTMQVTWRSSDTSKATISSTGLATGITFGSATTPATSGSIFGSTSVNIVTLSSIAVTPSNPSIVNGTTVQLTATASYSDSSTEDLTTQVVWSSSDNTKATVSSTGLVTAVATGSTTLAARSGNISGSTQANAFQPSTPSPDWVTFQGDAGHSGFVNARFDPALFA